MRLSMVDHQALDAFVGEADVPLLPVLRLALRRQARDFCALVREAGPAPLRAKVRRRPEVEDA